MGLLQAGTYNPAALQLVVNGTRITGLSEDGVQFEPIEAMGEVTQGLDGGLTYSFNPLTARKCSISVDPTKRGYKDLAELRQSFEDTIRGGNPMPSFPFVYKDPINGTEIVGARCMFLNRPIAQGQKLAGAVVFELVVDQPQERHAARL